MCIAGWLWNGSSRVGPLSWKREKGPRQAMASGGAEANFYGEERSGIWDKARRKDFGQRVVESSVFYFFLASSSFSPFHQLHIADGCALGP